RARDADHRGQSARRARRVARRRAERRPAVKAFDLVTPATLEQALELLPKGQGPKERARVNLLAGGHVLLGELKGHPVEPAELLNLKRMPGLDRSDVGADGAVRIGALATSASIEEHDALAALHPILREAAHSIGSPQIRAVGTLGGNLCQRPRCWYYRNE